MSLIDSYAQVYSKPITPKPTPTPFFQDIIIQPSRAQNPSVFAEASDLLSAVVIVEKDYLRFLPSKTAKIQIAVIKGSRLKVIRDETSKGWYLAYLEESPSVFGYIFGNSIKIVKPPKARPDIEKPTPNLHSTRSNYCQPPLYCPDIADVQASLIENKDKFQKGKFEKTADWEKRKPALLREIKLKEGKTTADKLVFLYEQGTLSSDLNTPDYDADKELWTFPLLFRETSDQTCLPVFSQGSGQVLCLMTRKKLGKEVQAFVSMLPSLAAANEKYLQIAFVGNIIEPYFWTNESSSIRDVLSGIHIELEEIICLNTKTGQRWKVDISIKNENTFRSSNNIKNEPNLSDEVALEQFKKTLIADPKNAEAHLGIGKIYSRLFDYDAAISAFKTAILWNDKLIDGYVQLGRIYFIKSDCQQAEYYLKKALEIDSQNSSVASLKTLFEKCSVGFLEPSIFASTPKTPKNLSTNSEPNVAEPTIFKDVAGKSFRSVGGIWTDVTYNGDSTTTVERSTDKYKKLDSGLRSITDYLGGTVIMVWKGKSYKIQ